MRTLPGDRGQAIGIGRGLATIVAIGAIFSFMTAIWNPLKTEVNAQNSNATVQTGLDYTTTYMSNVLFVVLSITAMGVIALAVYQRQGGV